MPAHPHPASHCPLSPESVTFTHGPGSLAIHQAPASAPERGLPLIEPGSNLGPSSMTAAPAPPCWYRHLSTRPREQHADVPPASASLCGRSQPPDGAPPRLQIIGAIVASAIVLGLVYEDDRDHSEVGANVYNDRPGLTQTRAFGGAPPGSPPSASRRGPPVARDLFRSLRCRSGGSATAAVVVGACRPACHGCGQIQRSSAIRVTLQNRFQVVALDLCCAAGQGPRMQ